MCESVQPITDASSVTLSNLLTKLIFLLGVKKNSPFFVSCKFLPFTPSILVISIL